MPNHASRRDFFGRLLASSLAVLGWRPHRLSGAPTAPPLPPTATGAPLVCPVSAMMLTNQGSPPEIQTFTWTGCDAKHRSGVTT